MKERIGILGGTFDPVHVGHLVAAVQARHALALDRVLLMVAGDPWQKQGAVVASAADRVDMAMAAADGIDGLEVSTLEVERKGPSYMVDTLQALESPDRRIFLIVGSDVASTLETWHRADDLKELATLAVLDRAGVAESSHITDLRWTEGWNVEWVPMPHIDISSTELRARMAAGSPIDGLVPQEAVRVIRQRRLYTAGR